MFAKRLRAVMQKWLDVAFTAVAVVVIAIAVVFRYICICVRVRVLCILLFISHIRCFVVGLFRCYSFLRGKFVFLVFVARCLPQLFSSHYSLRHSHPGCTCTAHANSDFYFAACLALSSACIDLFSGICKLESIMFFFLLVSFGHTPTHTTNSEAHILFCICCVCIQHYPSNRWQSKVSECVNRVARLK